MYELTIVTTRRHRPWGTIDPVLEWYLARGWESYAVGMFYDDCINFLKRRV